MGKTRCVDQCELFEWSGGVELEQDSSGNTALPEAGGAESDAVGAPPVALPPDLAEILSARAGLDEPTRRCVLAIVRQATGGES